VAGRLAHQLALVLDHPGSRPREHALDGLLPDLAPLDLALKHHRDDPCDRNLPHGQPGPDRDRHHRALAGERHPRPAGGDRGPEGGRELERGAQLDRQQHVRVGLLPALPALLLAAVQHQELVQGGLEHALALGELDRDHRDLPGVAGPVHFVQVEAENLPRLHSPHLLLGQCGALDLDQLEFTYFAKYDY